jgi:hypothetical protein
MNHAFGEALRQKLGKSPHPSAVATDSQSVKTTEKRGMCTVLSVNTVNVLVNTINVRNKNGYDVLSALLAAFFCEVPRINRLVVRKFIQKINTINVRLLR